jgi:predicted RNA-binding protein with PUA-like domain
MNYWLIKSEPLAFSIDDLNHQPKKTTYWDGVRNYQARNTLRDEMKKGDLVFFYHSNCTPPGIVGIVEVVKEGYPDYTAQDPNSDHYDPTATSDNPRWYMVDVQLKQRFSQMISLDELKQIPGLESMKILQRGNRLSVTPVTAAEWKIISAMA